MSSSPTNHKVTFSLVILIIVTGVLSLITHVHIFSAILTWACLSLGCWLLIFVSQRMFNSVMSHQWVPVFYRVTETRIVIESQAGTDGTESYTPYFEIEYKFLGHKYVRSIEQGFNFHLNPMFYMKSKAMDYVSSLQSESLDGNTVLVNPAAPEVAFFRSGLTRDDIGIFIFCLILIIIPVLTLTGWLLW